eukprot:4076597-Karenia_brevis.AAC.1
MAAACGKADAAYLGSRSLTHEICIASRPGHKWDSDDPRLWLAQAAVRCNGLLDGAGIASRIDCSQVERS